MDFPPKDRKQNIIWREFMQHTAATTPSFRKTMLERCREDFLFWINAFCWLFEPRPDKDDPEQRRIIPFTSWPHQDQFYRDIKKDFGFEDIGVIKSRAEGASWIILMMQLHRCIFFEMESHGVVSRTELMSDNPNDPSSCLWKVGWQLQSLPTWMIEPSDYKRNKSEHTFFFKKTSSTMIGYSATGDVARGGRMTSFLMDEFASFKPGDDTAALDATRDVTNCRIFLSTPKGPVGSFYDLMRKSSSMKQCGLWWYDNPTKNRGLYKVRDGKLTLLDVPYWMERGNLKTVEELHAAAAKVTAENDNNAFNYEFMLTGDFVKNDAYRSVWYDKQCRRGGANPRSISQELDGDFGGSASRFFNILVIDKLIQRHCRKPLVVGTLMYDAEVQGLDPRFSEGQVGDLEIYSSWLAGNQIPLRDHEYYIGIDIAAGNGTAQSSNSCIWVFDYTTRMQAAQLTSPSIVPERLGELACAMSMFYRGPNGPATMIPEVNGGAATTFLNRVRDLGMIANCYHRRTEDSAVRKITNKPGFHAGKSSKPLLLAEFRRALADNDIVVLSESCLNETKDYMLLGDGKVEHAASVSADDPTGTLANHGDRVVAAACAWWGARDQHQNASRGKVAAKEAIIPPDNSIAGRLQERLRRAKSSSMW